jgi:hypothetical protein
MLDLSEIIRTAVAAPKGEFNTEHSELFKIEKLKLIPIKKILTNNLSTQSGIGIAEEIFRYISIELMKKDGIVRMRALDLIDYLFARSVPFRNITSLKLSTVVRAGGFLPRDNGSSERANTFQKEISEKVKELIELWDHIYGMKIASVHVMARYLRESLRVEMPNIMVDLLGV